MGGGRLYATVLSLDRRSTYRFLAIREAFELEGSGKKLRLSRLQDSRQLFIPELIDDLESENAGENCI